MTTLLADKKDVLLHRDLTYKINGILFEVFKELGGGHAEKYYQKAVAIGLKNCGIKFAEQHQVPLNYAGEKVGKYFLDFLIDDKIILELKRGLFIPANVIRQTKQYLVATRLQLALIACFTHNGVIIKRVLNIY